MALRALALIVLGSVAGASANAAECFKQCPQLSNALDGVITEYLETSNVSAINASICAEQEAFTCMLEDNHTEVCGDLSAVGPALGVPFPTSTAQLREMCSSSADTACPDSTNPLMSVVTDLLPECFKQCPQLCNPLDGVIAEYMATSDVSAVNARICAEQEAFTCMFEDDHIEACEKVLAAGLSLGVPLPTSTAQLREQCSSSSSLRGGGAKYKASPLGDNNSTTVTGLL